MPRLLFLLCAMAASLSAAVRAVEIIERTPSLNGYERILGRVRFGVNPKLAANRLIRDIEFAPLNRAGEVEFAADLYLLRPQDPAKANGTVLLEISNRGGKGMPNRFMFGRGGDDPKTPEDFGDLSLLQQGYTLAWIGWEWDIPESAAGKLRFSAPRFRPDALPATGLVRSEFVTATGVNSMPLADRGLEPVAVGRAVALYVRDRADRPPRQIPSAQWRLSAGSKSVEMPSGFQPGLLYEFVYEGKDPVVAGAGLAAVRDWISFQKYGGIETALGDQRPYSRRALGFGISQSGRFLRHFLYEGFNADEAGRKVFDGVWADVAGAGRGSFNFRYAQPSRDGCAFLNIFYPTDLFPFVDTELLARARAARAVPKLFLTNNSYEYWGRAAALIHTTPDGKRDAEHAPDTRYYFLSGVQHYPRSLPLALAGLHLGNPVDHRPVQRGLLAALQAWVKDGVAPPPSVYPKLAAGHLTTLAGLKFPALAGVTVPQRPRIARKLDFGPRFESRGIILKEPPAVTGEWPLLVPQVDSDGIDLGGIRLPELAVPVATITGWNLRAPGRGAPEEMAEFNGSIFPFAKTRAERESSRDPRPSLAERYRGRDEYLERVTAAAAQLVESRFVLPADRAFLIERALRLWDTIAR